MSITREEAIDIIKAERECVYRQGRTGECCRDDLGCGACDLVQKDVDIIEAYDMAIKALQRQNYSPNSKSVFELMREGEKSGAWLYTGETDEIYGDIVKCSVCGAKVLSDCISYCGNCGAKMEEGEK